MLGINDVKIKVKTLIRLCYGICIFVFVLAQSYLPESSHMMAVVCNGVNVIAIVAPALLLLRYSKRSIRNLATWGIMALYLLGNIFLNQASNDLVYIIVFTLYLSNIDPEDVLETYWVSSIVGLLVVIIAWYIGIIPAYSINGREYLGFYFATAGPNLFLHAVLSFVASRKNNRIELWTWAIIEIINIWFFKKTHTRAVFIMIVASFFFYYVFGLENFKRFIFNNKIIGKLVEGLPIISATLTIVAQLFYNAHSRETILVKINAILSNRPYFGKVAIERYGISLFGQPITWVTSSDGSKVSGMDYFFVDSSYIQILLRYGVIMLVVICIAMTVVQSYGVFAKNAYMCLGCSLFLIHCITDPQLLSFRYNAFIMTSIACLAKMKTNQINQRSHINNVWEIGYESVCRDNSNL